jgi:putative tricarboxylic transport membrane protein
MTATGALGYVLRKFEFDVAPIVLGIILSPMLEMSFRQSLALSGGSYAIFVSRPIAGSMLGLGLALLLLGLLPWLARQVDWRRRVGLDDAK